MTCPKCGNPNTEGQKFCERCGEALTQQSQQSYYQPQQSQQAYYQPQQPQQTYYQPQQTQATYYQQSGQGYNPYDQSQLATRALFTSIENSHTALTLSILAFVFSFFCWSIWFVYLILAIIALVKVSGIAPINNNGLTQLERELNFKLEKRKNTAKGLSIAAILLPIGVILLMVIFGGAILTLLGGIVNELQYMI